MGTYGGDAIFGLATSFVGVANPDAEQLNQFFGVSGLQALWGGSRGWMIQVSGILFGLDAPSAVAAEGLLLSYKDGIARTLVDNFGRIYPDCVFTGPYQADPMGPRPCSVVGAVGVGIRYQATFRTLSG